MTVVEELNIAPLFICPKCGHICLRDETTTCHCGAELIETILIYGDYCRMPLDEKSQYDKHLRETYTIGSTEFDAELYALELKNDFERHMRSNRTAKMIEDTETKIKCPTCHSTNTHKISAGERGLSVLTLGLLSKKINKTFKCNKCGYTW